MLKTTCVILALLVIAVSVVECVFSLSPLEQFTALCKWQTPEEISGDKTVLRLGLASWQLDEFPWEETIAAYEQRHPDVKVKMSIFEGPPNTLLLFWADQHTSYDLVVSYSDAELHPFMDYQWNSPDPAKRGLLVNIRDYLSDEQKKIYNDTMPAMLAGCSKCDRCPMCGKAVADFSIARPFRGYTVPFCSAGHLADWDKIKDQPSAESDDPQMARFSAVMNVYEVPWMGEVLALNYNKRFFQERGVEKPPATWDEVEALCTRLKGMEYQGVKVAPLAFNWSSTAFFVQNCYIPLLASYKGGRGITDDKGRLDVSCPEALRVFETLKRWQQAGFISNNCYVDGTIEQDLRVMRAAMYPHWQSRGLWALKDHGPDIIGIAPSPGSTTDKAGSLVCTYGCIIPKCSPNIKAAIDFSYEAFGSDALGFQTHVANGFDITVNGKTEHKGGGKMPVLRAIYRQKLAPGINELEPALASGYTYPDAANFTEVSLIIVAEFQKYVSGATPTAQEALAKAQKRIDQEVYSN